jgi:hypothetical protein
LKVNVPPEAPEGVNEQSPMRFNLDIQYIQRL